MLSVCKHELAEEPAEDRCLKNAMKTGRLMNTKNLYVKEAEVQPKPSLRSEPSKDNVKVQNQPQTNSENKKVVKTEEYLGQLQKIKPKYYLIKRNQFLAADLNRTKASPRTLQSTAKSKAVIKGANPFVDMSDDSSDCSNAENKLDNFYAESRKIENNLLETHRNKEKEAKFGETVNSVIRLEYLRRKILETNCEKINRVFKE